MDDQRGYLCEILSRDSLKKKEINGKSVSFPHTQSINTLKNWNILDGKNNILTTQVMISNNTLVAETRKIKSALMAR